MAAALERIADKLAPELEPPFSNVWSVFVTTYDENGRLYMQRLSGSGEEAHEALNEAVSSLRLPDDWTLGECYAVRREHVHTSRYARRAPQYTIPYADPPA